MVIRKALVALAATGLVFGSTAAAAAPAPAETARVASPVNETENLRGWFWILLVFAAVGGLIYALTGSDEPASP